MPHRMGDSMYLHETMSDRIQRSSCGFHLLASGLVKHQFAVRIVSREQKKPMPPSTAIIFALHFALGSVTQQVRRILLRVHLTIATGCCSWGAAALHT